MKVTKENRSLPDYLNVPLAQVVEQARELQGEDTVQFIFITDLHHYEGGNQLRTADAIRRLTEEISPDCIVCGGDISGNGIKVDIVEAQREMIGALRVPECPMLPVKGNHDDNSLHDFPSEPKTASNVIFPIETYEIWLKGLEGTVVFDKGNELGLYYYYDIPDKKTRIVVLNCIDIRYQVSETGGLAHNGQWEYAYSDRQVKWVEQKVFDFGGKPDGDKWKTIFFTHVAIFQESVYGADHEVTGGEAMWSILKANRRQVAACFFGHVHFDQVLLRDGIPMISTLNALTYQDFDSAPVREFHKLTETAFDIVSIDYAKGELITIRFGAGEDRMVSISC